MSELFPNRRYVVVGPTGRRSTFHERDEAIDQARGMSKDMPDLTVRIDVIEEAEPVGHITFRKGLMTTSRDAR